MPRLLESTTSQPAHTLLARIAAGARLSSEGVAQHAKSQRDGGVAAASTSLVSLSCPVELMLALRPGRHQCDPCHHRNPLHLPCALAQNRRNQICSDMLRSDMAYRRQPEGLYSGWYSRPCAEASSSPCCHIRNADGNGGRHERSAPPIWAAQVPTCFPCWCWWCQQAQTALAPPFPSCPKPAR